jgi:aminomethyltransferase
MSKSSPFESVHERLGANFSEYNGWRLPCDYGDPAAEARAIDEGIAAFDLSSFGKISIKGPVSKAVVENLLSENTDTPAEGFWIWAGFGDKQEKVTDLIRVGNIDGNYMIFTSPENREAVFASAQQIAGQKEPGDVNVIDLTEKTGMLGVYGPGAVTAVGNILPFDISGVGKEGICNVSFFMMSVTIIRGSWVGADGFELLCPAMACNMAGAAISKYHARENMVPAGMECLQKAIAAAKPHFSGSNLS